MGPVTPFVVSHVSATHHRVLTHVQLPQNDLCRTSGNPAPTLGARLASSCASALPRCRWRIPDHCSLLRTPPHLRDTRGTFLSHQCSIECIPRGRPPLQCLGFSAEPLSCSAECL